MIKDYIKEFDTNSEYQSYIAGDPVLPNVSYIVETNGVEFKPYIIPPRMDIITYEASTKLAETTSIFDSGIHTDAFNTTIKSHTFENNVGTIEFNGDVTSIGLRAFKNCSGITSITIPDSVTSIGEFAFQSCSGLTSITIPNSVISIGKEAFTGCTGFTSIGGVGSGASVEIPDTITSIGNSVFMGCTSLTSVTIPNNVTSIDRLAFYNCIGLTSVTIPNNVTSIGDEAFRSCTGLTSITIDSGITSIGNGAFSGCTGLTNIICNATVAPTIQYETFYNVKTGGTLTVPSGSTGYNVWMGTSDYYLGKYNWTKVEQ